MEIPILKAKATDFIVSECLALAMTRQDSAEYHYLRLRKRGYTTFEAIDRIATTCGIPRLRVSAAGLKDEDAVTEQFVAYHGQLDSTAMADFNALHAGEERFISLATHGYGRRNIEIGELDGNSFRITVRNLSADFATVLRAFRGRDNLFFINYYDTQRFGVAGGPKQTHMIGRALLIKDHELAFSLLRESGSPEGKRALVFNGDAADFFGEIDPRVTAFYLCAQSSYLWNQRLRGLLHDACGGSVDEVDREGITFNFPKDQRGILAFLRNYAMLPYDKYRWQEGKMRKSISYRSTVVHTQFRVEEIELDDMSSGAWKCVLSFFLPSGCYATNAIAQWVHQRT